MTWSRGYANLRLSLFGDRNDHNSLDVKVSANDDGLVLRVRRHRFEDGAFCSKAQPLHCRVIVNERDDSLSAPRSCLLPDEDEVSILNSSFVHRVSTHSEQEVVRAS